MFVMRKVLWLDLLLDCSSRWSGKGRRSLTLCSIVLLLPNSSGFFQDSQLCLKLDHSFLPTNNLCVLFCMPVACLCLSSVVAQVHCCSLIALQTLNALVTLQLSMALMLEFAAL